MNSSFILRSRIIIICIIAFALILVAKLFLVQIVHSSSYVEAADRQYATPSSDIYERGTIYFDTKDGQLVDAATQTTGFKIAINPEKITDPEGTYEKINKIVNIDHGDFIASAEKKNDSYEEVAHKLTQEEADAVSALKLTAVSIFQEKWRFYPGGTLASNTLGLVGYQGNTLAGRYGLERQYDNVLSRSDDNPYVNFFAEVFSNIDKTFFQTCAALSRASCEPTWQRAR